MFANFTYLCSPSTSYLINYELQSTIYDWFDKKTDKTQWLKLTGIGMCCLSNSITLVTRVAGIAEPLFDGIGLAVSAPFTNNCLANAKLGLSEIFIHTPKNVLRTAIVPLEFFISIVTILFEPKFFTIAMNECMKVNLLHAKKHTIGSEEHYNNLAYVDGNVNERLLRFQGVIK